MSEQPYCRWCGKPIRKRTTRVFVYDKPPPTESLDRYTGHTHKLHVPEHVIGTPRSMADCRRLTNLAVVSVEYHHESKLVRSFGVWDGTSYEDQFFDTGACAQAMGYAAVRPPHGLSTAAYRKAVAAQKEKIAS